MDPFPGIKALNDWGVDPEAAARGISEAARCLELEEAGTLAT